MKRVKFKLPAGASLGPFRHLGNGEFICDYGDASGLNGDLKPGEKFGEVVETECGRRFEAIPMTVCDDPLDCEPVLARAGAPFVVVHNGKAVVDSDLIDAMLTDYPYH